MKNIRFAKDFEYVGTAGDINYKISLQNIYEEITDGKMTDINYEFYFMFSEKIIFKIAIVR